MFLQESENFDIFALSLSNKTDSIFENRTLPSTTENSTFFSLFKNGEHDRIVAKKNKLKYFTL
ncbi:hypothetical protein OA84_07575 [Kaistella solincola]|uniref:Uncharacterized protein n=1 Tax=Kaistella solincola TaxID=510955 RepID=A0ABR4ZRN8_9FLAO|nr:hypothetical protein OA84_07575 [Kaistella solincola]